MRVTFVFLLMLLHSTAAFGGGDVNVGKTLVTIAPTMEGLHELCAGAGSYDACTRFVAWKLETSCERSGSAWSIHAAAAFTPFILLRNVEKMPHEQEHIRDVTARAAAYVAQLEAATYPSESQCRARSVIESARFELTLRGMAEASNLAMHPQLARAKKRPALKPQPDQQISDNRYH